MLEKLPFIMSTIYNLFTQCSQPTNVSSQWITSTIEPVIAYSKHLRYNAVR